MTTPANDWQEIPTPEGASAEPMPRVELPPIVTVELLAADDSCAIPAEAIEGVLHRGSKMVIGAASKARKSWLLDDLAICLATGRPFLRWATKQTRVLLIDLELRMPFLKDRLGKVLGAKGMVAANLGGNLFIWPLRGHARALRDLASEIKAAIQAHQVGVLILDPSYRLYTGDENSAQDMNAFCLELERIATECGVAIITTAHFSKGNASGKNAIDRISGSGVVARDADTLMMLTAHQVENCLSVEMILRNHPPVDGFVIELTHPLVTIREDLNAADLKPIKLPTAKTAKALIPEQVLAHVPPGKTVPFDAIVLKLNVSTGIGIKSLEKQVRAMLSDSESGVFQWKIPRVGNRPETHVAREPQTQPEMQIVNDLKPKRKRNKKR